MTPSPAKPAAWISPLLHAKHAWEGGRHEVAMERLEEILAEPHGLPVLYLPPNLLDQSSASTFEVFVTKLVTGRYLMIPFASAIRRLWAALPAQYVVHCLSQRQTFEGDLDEEALAILYDAARDGVLSFEPEDYDAVAKVMFRADDFPQLAARLDLPRLEALVSAAAERHAWEAYVEAHGELVTNLLFYTAFHRGKVRHATTAADILHRIRERQATAIAVAARTLRGWLAADADLTDVVRVGIASNAGPADCAVKLLAVLEGDDFGDFGACLEERRGA